ncbi:MAG: hypothetical protein LBC75_02635 [Fibromonadaceae bacterium]|jgi:hypothetical protein|nr:hypothetical protein [Fibromonadaceae bacterium]
MGELGDYSSIILGAQDRRDRQNQGIAMGLGSLYKRLTANKLNSQIEDKFGQGDTAGAVSLSRRGIAMGLPTFFTAEDIARREQQEHQKQMQKEMLAAQMGVRLEDRKQQDLDNARGHYDRAEEGYRTLFGNANAAWQEWQKAKLLDPTESQETTKSLRRNAEALREQMQYQLKKSEKFREYIEQHGAGFKPSNALFADRASEPQATDDVAAQEPTADNQYISTDDLYKLAETFQYDFLPQMLVEKRKHKISPRDETLFENLVKDNIASREARLKFEQARKGVHREDVDYADKKEEDKFNRAYSEWEKSNPTYSALKAKADDFEINSGKAAAAFKQENYKGVVEFVKGFVEDAERLAIKIPFVSYKPKDDYTREDAIKALTEYQAGKKVVQDKIEAMEKSRPQRKK